MALEDIESLLVLGLGALLGPQTDQAKLAYPYKGGSQ